MPRRSRVPAAAVNDDSIEKLIELVRKNHHLYDPQELDHMDATRITNTWVIGPASKRNWNVPTLNSCCRLAVNRIGVVRSCAEPVKPPCMQLPAGLKCTILGHTETHLTEKDLESDSETNSQSDKRRCCFRSMNFGLAKCIQGTIFLLQVGTFHLSMDPQAIKSIWTDFFFNFILVVIPVCSIAWVGALVQFINEKWCSLHGWIFFLGQLLTIWNGHHNNWKEQDNGCYNSSWPSLKTMSMFYSLTLLTNLFMNKQRLF